jgi:DNA modification methylase
MDEFVVEMLDPRTLTPNPSNWRKHPDRQNEALAASIAEHGWLAAPIFNKRTGRLVDGHARVEQAIGFGTERIPVRVIDVSEEKELRILASFDRIGELRDRDDRMLADLLKTLADTDAGLPAGWEMGDLEEILAGLPSLEDEPAPAGPGKGGDDFDPDTPVETRCKVGDVWRLGRHELVVGDSGDAAVVGLLMGDELADQVVADPPYGISLDSLNKGLNKYIGGTRNERTIANDAIKDYVEFFGRFLGHLPLKEQNSVYVFMSGKHIHDLITAFQGAGGTMADLLVWVKDHQTLSGKDYQSRHELILYGARGKRKFYGDHSSNVLEFKRVPKCDLHPTMKPVDLLAELVGDGSPEKGIVYDPFAGSGSVMVACERTGRSCRMVELEPHYGDVILARYQAETGQEPLRVVEGA